MQRVVDINVAANNLWGIATAKAQLAYFCHYLAGDINSLAEISSEALKIAEESGDPISRGISHTSYGLSCYAEGHLEDAKQHLLEGTNLCGSVGLYGWGANANASLGETYIEMKDYLKARESFDHSLRILEAAQIQSSWARLCQVAKTMCDVMLGDREVNLESLRALYGKNRVKAVDGWICRVLGEIFLNVGGSHVLEAEHWIQKAIEADERNGIRFHLGRDYALYGELFSRQGDRERAQAKLGKAIEILKECGADGFVRKYEEEMAKLT
jgi:tetratricopeptide (TPR) repeat protein